MYAMLTGGPPFAGDKPEITSAVLNRPPVFPRQWNPTVPKDLERICLRCLEKQPERRYATLRRLADELERFVNSG
jgi:eukaryotic-like serine/threonine-protein kinase